jgi:hypothetical protein
MAKTPEQGGGMEQADAATARNGAMGRQGDAIVVSVSALEADVAYFDARLSLLSEVPATRYQTAALKAYRTLERLLAERLAGLGPAQKPGRKDLR